MELFRLRVKDIDFGAGLILVRAAKGDKDRATILPVDILEAIRLHLKVRRHHLSEKSIQNAVATAVRKAAIPKHVTVHTLATHLLINGVNIREIQELLGHKNVETTMIYTHVMRDMTTAPKSQLDLLMEESTRSVGVE